MVPGVLCDGRLFAPQIAGSMLVKIDNSAHFTTLEQSAAAIEALRQWLTA